MIFAAPLNWLWLAGLGIVGWTIRHFFNLKNAGRLHLEVLAYGALGFATVAAAEHAVSCDDVESHSGDKPSCCERPCPSVAPWSSTTRT